MINIITKNLFLLFIASIFLSSCAKSKNDIIATTPTPPAEQPGKSDPGEDPPFPWLIEKKGSPPLKVQYTKKESFHYFSVKNVGAKPITLTAVLAIFKKDLLCEENHVEFELDPEEEYSYKLDDDSLDEAFFYEFFLIIDDQMIGQPLTLSNKGINKD